MVNNYCPLIGGPCDGRCQEPPNIDVPEGMALELRAYALLLGNALIVFEGWVIVPAREPNAEHPEVERYPHPERPSSGDRDTGRRKCDAVAV